MLTSGCELLDQPSSGGMHLEEAAHTVYHFAKKKSGALVRLILGCRLLPRCELGVLSEEIFDKDNDVQRKGLAPVLLFLHLSEAVQECATQGLSPRIWFGLVCFAHEAMLLRSGRADQ